MKDPASIQLICLSLEPSPTRIIGMENKSYSGVKMTGRLLITLLSTSLTRTRNVRPHGEYEAVSGVITFFFKRAEPKIFRRKKTRPVLARERPTWISPTNQNAAFSGSPARAREGTSRRARQVTRAANRRECTPAAARRDSRRRVAAAPAKSRVGEFM